LISDLLKSLFLLNSPRIIRNLSISRFCLFLKVLPQHSFLSTEQFPPRKAHPLDLAAPPALKLGVEHLEYLFLHRFLSIGLTKSDYVGPLSFNYLTLLDLFMVRDQLFNEAELYPIEQKAVLLLD
jgi:hypothetical protein